MVSKLETRCSHRSLVTVDSRGRRYGDICFATFDHTDETTEESVYLLVNIHISFEPVLGSRLLLRRALALQIPII